jgi:two-component sensor histidine kinase
MEKKTKKPKEKGSLKTKILFPAIIENFPYPIVTYAPDGTSITANLAWETMWNDKRENLKVYNIRKDPQMIASGLDKYVEKAFAGEIAVSDVFPYDPAVIGEQGRKRWIQMVLFPLKNKRGKVSKVNLILQDLTDTKEFEAELKKSIEEKMLLLKELSHRTKNNMQVISSFIHLQKRYTNDEKLDGIFNDLITRIQAISLVHQKLDKAQNLSRVNLKQYIPDLLKLIAGTYNLPGKKITVNYEIENIDLLIDLAVPCGLVINEIISNSYKHAFPENRDGIIDVEVKKDKDDLILLSISDNGVGIPKDFDLKHSNSIGVLTIINIIELQLQGTIDYKNSDGLSWNISFKEQWYEERI